MADELRSAPFERAHGKLGFGAMRLPLLENGSVDTATFSQMVDAYLAAGFNYFDTARVYLKGQSETALAECLTSRRPRDSYFLVDKLTGGCFERREDIRPLIESQLASCGVEYFDLYLMHAQSSQNYEKYQSCGAYEEASRAKTDGLVHHMGISFHDSAAMLERILTDHPEIECVQLQLNYLDWDSPAVQSRACYEVCRAHGLPVMVMEPVKGGTLINLPPEAARILEETGLGTDANAAASLALRFAADHEGVEMVLSGMGSMQMVEGNIRTFSPLKPLSPAEKDAISRIVEVLHAQHSVPCTACRYCTDGCPRHIPIPDIFACLNSARAYGASNGKFYYKSLTGNEGVGSASDCVRCGKCEAVCPQHLPIRDLLAEAAHDLES